MTQQNLADLCVAITLYSNKDDFVKAYPAINSAKDVWDIYHMTMKEVRVKAKYTQKKLSYMLMIPLRTIENWDMGVANCSIYLKFLIAEKLGLITIENE